MQEEFEILSLEDVVALNNNDGSSGFEGISKTNGKGRLII